MIKKLDNMDPQLSEKLEVAKRAIVRVGEGRGFVVEAGRFERRYVITAAHCLDPFPNPTSISHGCERTYRDLLGPCDEQTAICAECLFADPIGDIAVLGPPDEDNFREEYRAYEELTESIAALPISGSVANGRAWLLSLDKHWFQCDVEIRGDPKCLIGPLLLSTEKHIEGGMSGSPILSADGKAIGVLCTAGGTAGGGVHTVTGPNPQIRSYLPPRLI